MDDRSEAVLAHVHPDLAKVMRAASERVAFLVIQGLRTVAQEAANVAHGASQTMHSRHLPNAQGLASAVDVAALDEGHVSWAPPLYTAIRNAVMAEAALAGIPVEWGGAWTTLKDLGHFQLPWKQYP